NNSLTINEGATVVLDGNDLSAIDAETAAGSLTFTISGVTGGQFEFVASPGAAITTFTQAQITNGDVQFVHDGGENAPAYNVEVSDGSLTDGPEAAVVTFNNANDAPELGNNSLTINEGATVVLDGNDLSATDAETAAGSLTFTVSGVAGGQFELVASPGSEITTFTQAQIINGDVQFVHDGGENAPAYNVEVSDGSLTDGPEAAVIAFNNVNDAPELQNNSLTLGEGDTVVLDDNDLSATDAETATGSLAFTVSGVTGGRFELVAMPGAAITTFTQAQIANGDVQFVHDGVESAPAYNVTVSDGSLNDGPEAAIITFNNVNDAPELANNALTISEGATVVLDGSDLSATDAETAAVSLAFTVSGVTGGQFELVASPGSAITTFTQAQIANGDVLFVHDGGEAAPSYAVTVSDGTLSDGPQSAAITFANVNDAPATSVVTLAAIAEDDGPQLITQAHLLANATDIDNTSLVATDLNIATGGGTLIDNGDGTWTYTPAANDDSAVAFSYVVSDGSLTAVGSANLDLLPVNDTPQLTVNTLTIERSETIVLDAANIAATDLEISAADLMFTVSDVSGGQFELAANPGAAITTFTQAQIAAGDVQFVHDGADRAPTFTTVVSDGDAVSGPQAAVINFTGGNTPPSLIADIASVQENQISVGQLQATDANNDALTFALAGGADADSFELDAQSGSLSFREAQDYEAPADTNQDGVYELTVQVDDGQGGVSQSSLNIELANVNEAPTADDAQWVLAADDAFGLIAVLSATDVDAADQLTYSIVSDSSDQGVFAVDPLTGQISSTSNQALEGQYDLQIQVMDLSGVSVLANVKITLIASNKTVVPDVKVPESTPFVSSPSNDTADAKDDASASPSTDSSGSDAQDATESDASEGDAARPDAADAPTALEMLNVGNADAAVAADLQQRASAVFDLAQRVDTDQPGGLADAKLGFTIMIENLLQNFGTGAVSDAALAFGSLEINVPPDLVAALDKMMADENQQSQQIDWHVSGAIVGSVAMSAGFVTWILRAGSLLGSLLASRPLWSTLDPLPIFVSDDENDDSDPPLAR
ncbi:MAG: cadherin-like domain-containing protein, partial [Gammaproteobacteria bacterium]